MQKPPHAKENYFIFHKYMKEQKQTLFMFSENFVYTLLCLFFLLENEYNESTNTIGLSYNFHFKFFFFWFGT